MIKVPRINLTEQYAKDPLGTELDPLTAAMLSARHSNSEATSAAAVPVFKERPTAPTSTKSKIVKFPVAEQNVSLCGRIKQAAKDAWNGAGNAINKAYGQSYGETTISTHQDFRWGLSGGSAAVKDIFSWENNFIRTHWSHEFFTDTKHDATLLTDALKSTITSFACIGKAVVNLDPKEFLRHSGIFLLKLINFVLLGLKSAVSVEIFNFLKGAVGIIVSAIKLALRIPEGIVRAFMALWNGRVDEVGAALYGILQNMVKDLATAFIALGHSIPSWLPAVLMAIPGLQLAGVGLGIVKLGSQFTGITDLVGYGGTGTIHMLEARKAQKTVDRFVAEKSLDSEHVASLISAHEDPAVQIASLAKNFKPEEAIEFKNAVKEIRSWNHLRDELDPNKSSEGALLAAFGANSAAEAVVSGLGFVPGVGAVIAPLAKPLVYSAVAGTYAYFTAKRLNAPPVQEHVSPVAGEKMAASA